MSKTFADLTLDELNSIGAEAGAEALRKAHAAGLAVPGMSRIRLSSGQDLKVLTSRHPDGTLEIHDPRVAFFAAKAGKTEPLQLDEPILRKAIFRSNLNNNDPPKSVAKKRERA
jgi:hypothetical protein